jgi:hypothetical protein
MKPNTFLIFLSYPVYDMMLICLLINTVIK